jgi:hypothetical protein
LTEASWRYREQAAAGSMSIVRSAIAVSPSAIATRISSRCRPVGKPSTGSSAENSHSSRSASCARGSRPTDSKDLPRTSTPTTGVPKLRPLIGIPWANARRAYCDGSSKEIRRADAVAPFIQNFMRTATLLVGSEDRGLKPETDQLRR